MHDSFNPHSVEETFFDQCTTDAEGRGLRLRLRALGDLGGGLFRVLVGNRRTVTQSCPNFNDRAVKRGAPVGRGAPSIRLQAWGGGRGAGAPPCTDCLAHLARASAVLEFWTKQISACATPASRAVEPAARQSTSGISQQPPAASLGDGKLTTKSFTGSTAAE